MRFDPFRRLGVWWLVAGVAAIGLLIMVQGGIRLGGVVVAVALVVAAIVRIARPTDDSGIRVRSPLTDVIVLLTLAALVAVTASIVNL